MNYHAEFLNLDKRQDRLIRMELELSRVGIKADRRRGKLPEEYNLHDPRLKVMKNRTPGAIGCHFGQIEIIKSAFEKGKNPMILEDDLVFCSDIHDRLKVIENFTNNNDWDVFWLGGTYHLNPTWHKSNRGIHSHPDLKMCRCTLNRDWEPTDNPLINRTYGAWSTHAYIVNYNSIEKILKLLDENLHLSMGIDWLFILLQPQLKTFAFNPGCVRQYDNESNIGKGITNFSGFSNLGEHWWADKM